MANDPKQMLKDALNLQWQNGMLEGRDIIVRSLQEAAGSAQGDIVGLSPGLTFVGGPDTIVKQIKSFHDRCGVGVLDLFFQQPSVDHRGVMKEIELFGKPTCSKSRTRRSAAVACCCAI